MNETSNAEDEEILYTNGEIITDVDSYPVEALLIRAGRIAAVGTNEEVLAQAGGRSRPQNLDGAIVIPGLIDSHPHLLHFAAFAAPLVDITSARDHDAIISAIRTRAAQTPKGEWIMTTPVGEPHYFHRESYRSLAEGVLPDRHALDRAALDHPVFIQAWAPVVPNMCALNSAGLAALGLDASTPDQNAHVWVDKDARGVPTGILRGSVNNYYNPDPFFAELRTGMPPLVRPELAVDALTEAMGRYNSYGITAIFEAHAMDFPLVELYRAMRAEDLLTLRVQISCELEGNALPGERPKSVDQVHRTLDKALAMKTLDDDWLRIDGITAAVYGGVDTGAFPWKAGYRDAWGAATTGRRSISEENTRYAFDFCARNGLRLNLCALSTEELDEYLELTEEAMRTYGIDRTRWILQHGCTIRGDQAKRFADMGYDMTVSMSFTFGMGDIYAERLGPEVLPMLNPLRQLLDAGLTVSGSMDWGPTNPFEQMQLAVTHRMFPSGRHNDGPAQVISRAEAFRMWTSAGAEVLGWNDIGTLSIGNHADIAILDRNPVTCPIDALPATRVLRTHVGGTVVHDSAELPAGRAGQPKP